MKRIVPFVLACILAAGSVPAADTPSPANPAIDMDAYLRVSVEAARWRESHRLTEAEFTRMSREPGTVVLDARSRTKFDELHVKDAVNLSFPDIAIESLARLLPDRDTRILIYCNNNFTGAPESMPTKAVSSALNLSTFVSLHAYGYRNVYELGPAVDVAKAKVIFEGDEIGSPPTRG